MSLGNLPQHFAARSKEHENRLPAVSLELVKDAVSEICFSSKRKDSSDTKFVGKKAFLMFIVLFLRLCFFLLF